MNLTQRPHKSIITWITGWDDKSQVDEHARAIFANADRLNTIVLARTDHVASVIMILEEIGAISKNKHIPRSS